MKIALLTPTFSGFSGIDRVVESQARDLTQSGDSVDIFAFSADMEPPAGVTLHLLGIPGNSFWHRIYRLFFPLDLIKNSGVVSRLCNYNVIYSHQYPMNWLALQAMRKFKVQYIYYDYGIPPPTAFKGLLEQIYMVVFTWLSNWTAGKANGAISISLYLKDELKKSTGLVSKVVYPKIDTNRFHPGTDGSAIRERYHLGDNPLILYLGRISPHKGIHLLIQAFIQVKQLFPGAHLLIAGKHTFSEYSKQLSAVQDGSVIFTGYVPDEEIPSYYAACDVYATATMWEGFNLPLAEAQACGKPVVAFKLGPHSEVVIEGETGYLVPAADTKAMAQAIIDLLNDSNMRLEMGKQATKFIAEKFT